VVRLEKLSEGGFNRLLLATLDDGLQVLVKIPYPLVVPKRYATASEVATLSFLAEKGVPVPKVYGYSCKAENPVGTEYIIMEYVPPEVGIGADSRWFETSKYEKHAVVTGLVEVERKLCGIRFGGVGRLYFWGDLGEGERGRARKLYGEGTGDEGRFCIGPVVDYMFWYGRREGKGGDYGPYEFFSLLVLLMLWLG
jgi:hypothetical protein